MGEWLNVKNEVRIFNQPFNGQATVKAGVISQGVTVLKPALQWIFIKKWSLETVLDVGGHSGPFEIEVITEKGKCSISFRSFWSHRTADDTGFLRFYQLFQRYYRSLRRISASL
jgi:hypothetical protein